MFSSHDEIYFGNLSQIACTKKWSHESYLHGDYYGEEDLIILVLEGKKEHWGELII